MKITNVVPTGVKSLSIELNSDEIQFLVDVLNCVGGDPVKSRRKYSADLLADLKNGGVDTSVRNLRESYDHSGSIYFVDKD